MHATADGAMRPTDLRLHSQHLYIKTNCRQSQGNCARIIILSKLWNPAFAYRRFAYLWADKQDSEFNLEALQMESHKGDKSRKTCFSYQETARQQGSSFSFAPV